MPSITVITTFNATGLEKYGRTFVASFERYWEPGVALIVYSEGFELSPPSPRVSVVDLPSASRNLTVFKNHYARQPQANGVSDGVYNYNFDAVRFAHKMFALFDARRRVDSRYLIWLDGDVETRAPVSAEFIEGLMADGAAVAYLGRAGMHTETGFLCFDLAHPEMVEFFRTMERFYLTAEIFNLNAWHDCEVFDVTRSVFAAQGKISCANLSPDPSSQDPFAESVLGRYMSHFKGEQKGVTPGVARYAQIETLIDLVRPGRIAEIGTWNGGRAIQMLKRALRHCGQVHYRGYDLFDEATDESDARELNGKSRVRLQDVRDRLTAFCRQTAGASFDLVQGDTRETLAPTRVDLAFVDGGHSVETIASDYGNLQGSRLVVFDDFYVAGVDTGRFGCNRVVEGRPHMVLPTVDRMPDGVEIALAVVAEPDLLATIRRHFDGT